MNKKDKVKAKKARKKVIKSLLAGLSQESSDPDAADQRHQDMLTGIGEEDYLLPPQGKEGDEPADDDNDKPIEPPHNI